MQVKVNKQSFRVGLLPLKIHPGAPQENLTHLTSRLDEIEGAELDLLALPETTLTGYLYQQTDFDRFAEPISGPAAEAMGRIARRLGCMVCFGLLEKASEGVYDAAVLLNSRGEILAVHRKINEKPPFQTGTQVTIVNTTFGKLGLILCGDLFSAAVTDQIPSDLRLLLVPLARCFARQSPDRARWESEERAVYLDAVRNVGVPTVLVNLFEVGPAEPSFGGALFVGGDGGLLAEAPHGTDQFLVVRA